MDFRTISGLFYRIVPKARTDRILESAISSEGRFHHDNQPAIYVSPYPDWAEHAIKVYVRDDDSPRVICQLKINSAPVLDLRDRGQCASWGVDAALAAAPWLPERASGLPASTWKVADFAREKGADGMIYTARSEPTRWHLVLFNWSNVYTTGRIYRYPLNVSE